MLAYLPLSASDDPSDEPMLVWRDATDEIERIFDTYIAKTRTP